MKVEEVIKGENNTIIFNEKITESRLKAFIFNFFIGIANIFSQLCFRSTFPTYRYQVKILSISPKIYEEIPKSPERKIDVPELIQSAVKINELIIQPETAIEEPLVEEPEVRLVGDIQVRQIPIEIPDIAISFGNKYQGIQKVINFIQCHEVKGVEVPLPIGLSHEQVSAFLQQMAPDIFQKWETLGGKYRNSENPTTFFQDSDVSDLLKNIRQAIKISFELAKENSTKPFAKQLDAWLEAIRLRDSYLMVRSSSVEDTKELPNAGGNKSIGYVYPERSEVLEACGKVVASYFSIPSLRNCSEAGLNPFATVPTLSVLIQKLIGETVGGERDDRQIPISAVMFTQEPSYSEGDFKVTKISCTNGNGEGVVNNNRVACDTIYAIKSDIELSGVLEIYQNHEKPGRLAHVLNVQSQLVCLQLIENSLSVAQNRCLTKNMVKRLMDLAYQIENYFGSPMDMEMVIKNDVIHIVQARPIVRQPKQPTYLDDEALAQPATSPILQVEYAQAIVSGNESVMKINSQEEVLFCNTLDEADKGLYLHGLHKIIVFREKEITELSHAITNFNSRGIPCFYLADTCELEQMVDQLFQQSIIVCPQSGRLCLWDKSVDIHAFTREGQFDHPANIQISLDDIPQPQVRPPRRMSDLPVEVTDAFRVLKEATTMQAAQEAINALKQTSLVSQLKRKISSMRVETDVVESSTVTVLEKIKTRVENALLELEISFKEKRPRLERLFHIKTLSTLFSQQNDAINSFSLLDVDPLIDSHHGRLNYQKKLSFPPRLGHLWHIKDSTSNSEACQKWEEFLLGLEVEINASKISVEELKIFETMMQKLERFSALPMWINVFFLPTLNVSTSPIQVFQQLLALYNPGDEDLLSSLEKQLIEIKQLKNNIEIFANPQTFEAGWQTLESYSQYLIDKQSFILPFKNSSPITKIAALEFMRVYVEVFDTALKTMKGHSTFSVEEKISLLGRMLLVNFEVMSKWFQDLIGEENLRVARGWPLNRYLIHIKSKLISAMGRKDLENLDPSPDFSVLAATFNSLASYERHQPETIEDLLTTIHQNEMYGLAKLTDLIMPDLKTMCLSPILKDAIDIMKFKQMSTGRNYLPPKLCGTHFTKEGMAFHFNIGLRNHSATIQLECKWNEPEELLVHVNLFGEAEGRSSIMAVLVQLIDYTNMIKLQTFRPYTEQELAFSWRINQLQQLPIMISELDRLFCITMKRCQEQYVDAFFRMREREGLAEKIEEFFFVHPETVPVSFGNGIKYINKFLADPRGSTRLHELKDTYGVSDDRVERMKQINHLENLTEGFLSFWNFEKIDNSFWDFLIQVIPRFIEKQDNIDKLIENRIFQNKRMIDMAFAFAQTRSGSSSFEDIRIVSLIYVYLIKKEMHLNEILEFATGLLDFKDVDILACASELYVALLKKNQGMDGAKKCLSILEECDSHSNYLGWKIQDLQRELSST